MTTPTTTNVDFSANYRIAGYGGIAWYLRGYAKRWTEESWEHIEGTDPDNEGNYYYNEPEEYEDKEWVIAVMVGDDREFEVEVTELTLLPREDFCGVCGQIGCNHDGYERTE